VHTDIKGSPFFNIFSNCDVGPLTRNEARDLVLQPSERAGVLFTEDEVDWVLAQVGQHPFFLQRFCSYFFEEKLRANGDLQLEREQVRKHASKELIRHFEDTWDHLSEERRELVRYEAQQRQSSNRKLPELSESALFRKFVRDKYHLKIFNLRVEDIEDALININDARILGKCILRDLKVVSQRFDQHRVPSLIEQGQGVRDLLNQALECLRGSGIRRDTEVDWRHYNILHYRYFKSYLKNEQIQARLELTSIRQYYRERTKALEAMFNAILDLEASCSKTHEEEE
jgi:hypothetical protein